jgi:hypothetical protein
MHKKKGQVDIQAFSAIKDARRVQETASALGLVLHNGEELRQVLKVILADLEKQELQARRDESTDDSGTREYAFAKPLLELLGLIGRAEQETIGPRQQRAARSRRYQVGVGMSTMRRHTKQLAREFAQYLDSQPSSSSQINSNDAASRDIAEQLNALRNNPDHDRLYGMPAATVHSLLSAYAHTYQLIAVELDRVPEDKGSYRNPAFDLKRGLPYIEDQIDHYRVLRELARRGFDRGVPLSHDLWHTILSLEAPEVYSKPCLVARLLRHVDCLLPSFSVRQEELLSYVAASDGGHVYKFLALLEEDQVGIKVLDTWHEWAFSNPEPFVVFGPQPREVKGMVQLAMALNTDDEFRRDYLYAVGDELLEPNEQWSNGFTTEAEEIQQLHIDIKRRKLKRRQSELEMND